MKKYILLSVLAISLQNFSANAMRLNKDSFPNSNKNSSTDIDLNWNKTYQAEQATSFSGAKVSKTYSNYLGTGYVELGENGNYLEWNNITVPADGVYQVTFRYANGGQGLNPCKLFINGTSQLTDNPQPNGTSGYPFLQTYAFAKTNGWVIWRDLTIGMQMKKGKNILRMVVENKNGGPNVDQIIIRPNGPQQTAPPVDGAKGWDRMPEILSRVKAPQFPKKDFNITSFGAVGDSVKNCVQAINDAIKACSMAGGGRVLVPKGIYRIHGTIFLQSNVNLHLAEGARFNFRGVKSDYTKVYTSTEGNICYKAGIIYGYKLKNVAITGEGSTSVLDIGQELLQWKDGKIHAYADVALFPEDRPLNEARPNSIDLIKCENVLLSNYRIENYAFWCHLITNCNNVTIDGLDIYGFRPNNDGIDIQSCKDVFIQNCKIDTWDDCIVLKAGRDRDGREVLGPCQDVVIRNNTMKTDCADFAIGSEMAGGVRNVFVDDNGAGGRLLIKSNYDRGGYVQDLYVRNCPKIDRIALTFVNYNYRGFYFPTYYSGFTFENLSGLKNVSLEGRKENQIHNVLFKNCSKFSMKQSFVDGLQMQ
ncbi:hypothetical protein A5893_12950 [Pedobacter psychrophilus]|uniref:CBM6 domain-containing protein n=1 Tax=Pedobacter psychrophilus TaxID=1826909 RepID=A0A179DE18_9SPHI|nr:glycosyl hydrolase family 28 protein [Pedobacter psychrophilus]OAQ38940.1 hypothetical protein A5893_12950 [Pedobacter psychrophilus]